MKLLGLSIYDRTIPAGEIPSAAYIHSKNVGGTPYFLHSKTDSVAFCCGKALAHASAALMIQTCMSEGSTVQNNRYIYIHSIATYNVSTSQYCHWFWLSWFLQLSGVSRSAQ